MRGRDVEIRVLGSVCVHRDGEDVELGPQLRRVLAALVVRHDSVVSMDRLIDTVWMGEPPDGADGSLRTYVTRLRRAIDPDREGLITFQAPGYVLSLNGHELDSERFEADLDEAIRLLRTADDEAAMNLLTVSLGRWHGDAYAGFADEDWARPEAVRLQERRVEAAELLIEARLGAGDVEQAVADAQALTEAEPLRERPRALLLRALYAAGRQAEALREYREFRTLLVEEAGLDPSADLVELEGRIARADPSLSGSVRTLRGYELGERIGEGAFAVVHRAVQPGIDREVAIKIIRSELADRPEFVRRFEHEAQVVAAVEHPHVVPLYDYWREPGAAYLVMRLLRGGSVEDVLRTRGPFDRRATAELLRDVGGALEAAHRKGVVHRDVRPANLLLDEDGSAYLADFGIALPTATADDVVVASPAYASPELLRGEPTGVAADVLSLGVTTFELLTGRLPFADSDSRAQLIRRQLTEPLPSARATRPDLPREIDDILARATAKAPGDRHATVAALVDELVGALGEGVAVAPSTDEFRRRSRAAAANPYVGLHAFDERDADRFHGREALVTEIVEALEQQPFVVVVGPSGSGKSSVVRAGLVPALRHGAIAGSADWFITGMLPGADPIDALETALLRIAVNPPASLREQLDEPGGLLRAVRRVLPDDDTTLLVVIDQFEELFTMTATDEQTRFLDELAAAITTPGSPLRVAATLRADHYDVPLRHAGFAELVDRGTITVRPMSPDELERAIVAPAASVGVEVEPALVAELVAGVNERPAALPLLQFALTEGYERRVSDLMLASTHHDLGGLVGAVAARADRIVEAGGPDDEAETRRIFGRLVTLGEGVEDTRRRALRSELGDGERTAWLLDAFVTARLLTVGHDATTREPTVEVAHEALLRDWPRLRDWLADDRDDLRVLRSISSAADDWVASGRDPGELARGARLETSAELAARRPDLLSDIEAEWIAESQQVAAAAAAEQARAIEHDRRQNRRLRQLLVAAGVLVVLALVAGAVALVSRNQAVDSERQAEEAASEAEQQAALAAENEQLAVAAQENADIERLSALSAAQIDVAPDRAILLALEANRRRDDVDTRTAVHRAIATEPRLVGIFPPQLGDASIAVFSHDGSTGVAWAQASDDGRLAFFDPMSGESLGGYTSDVGVVSVRPSGDGSTIAVLRVDGTVEFIDPAGASVAPTLVLDGRIGRIALDDAGSTVVVVVTSEDGSLSTSVVDVATGEVRSTYPLDPGLLVSVPPEVAPDGSFFVQGVVSAEPGGLVAYDIVGAGGELIARTETPDRFPQVVGAADGVAAVGFFDGAVSLVDVESGDTTAELVGHTASITSLAVAEDLVVTAAADGTVRRWSIDGSTAGEPLAVAGEVAHLGRGAGGEVLASLRGAGHLVVAPDSAVVVEAIRPARSADIMPGADRYVTVDFEAGQMLIRSLDDDEVVARFDLPIAPPTYSADGEWILMTFPEETVLAEVGGDRRLPIDIEQIGDQMFGGVGLSGLLARAEAGGERVFMVAVSLSGASAAVWIDSASSDVIAGPVELPFAADFLILPDGRVLMGGENAGLAVLPADLDGPPTVVEGGEGYEALHQDPSSGLVVVGRGDGSVALLDVDTLSLEALESVEGSVDGGAFSPDGRLIAVSTRLDGVQLFDVASREQIGIKFVDVSLGIRGGNGMRWTADGTSLWIGGEAVRGIIRLDADPAGWKAIACGIVHRDLTADEWRTFVSDTHALVEACL